MSRMASFVADACQLYLLFMSTWFNFLIRDRYEAKMILEPPDVLVQPDFDFLVRHCMTMHPTVWDDLRRVA